MSDVAWMMLITLVFLVLRDAALAWKSRAAAAEVKAELERAKVLSDITLERLHKSLEEIHGLVNSSMVVALKTASVALRRVADMTGKREDVELAAAAETQYLAHETKQQALEAKILEAATARIVSRPKP